MASTEPSRTRRVYFAGSIRGGRDDAALYMTIIEALQAAGHEVLTEHVGAADLDSMGEAHLSEAGIFERDMAWLARSDCVVAECTMPSLGVGYELGIAENMGIPVLVLFRPAGGRSLSAMLRGNAAFKIHDYEALDEATREAISTFVAAAPERDTTA